MSDDPDRTLRLATLTMEGRSVSATFHFCEWWRYKDPEAERKIRLPARSGEPGSYWMVTNSQISLLLAPDYLDALRVGDHYRLHFRPVPAPLVSGEAVPMPPEETP